MNEQPDDANTQNKPGDQIGDVLDALTEVTPPKVDRWLRIGSMLARLGQSISGNRRNRRS